VPFTFRVSRYRQALAVFEEQRDARGEADLVAVFADPNHTDREFDELRADAIHR
jgi:hypothetical protein